MTGKSTSENAVNPKAKHEKFTMRPVTNINHGYKNQCYPKSNPKKQLTLITWKLQG